MTEFICITSEIPSKAAIISTANMAANMADRIFTIISIETILKTLVMWTLEFAVGGFQFI